MLAFVARSIGVRSRILLFSSPSSRRGLLSVGLVKLGLNLIYPPLRVRLSRRIRFLCLDPGLDMRKRLKTEQCNAIQNAIRLHRSSLNPQRSRKRGCQPSSTLNKASDNASSNTALPGLLVLINRTSPASPDAGLASLVAPALLC